MIFNEEVFQMMIFCNIFWFWIFMFCSDKNEKLPNL